MEAIVNNSTSISPENQPFTFVECDVCGGTGDLDCRRCDDGRITNSWGDRVWCPDCDGNGVRDCNHCKGTGKLEVPAGVGGGGDAPGTEAADADGKLEYIKLTSDELMLTIREFDKAVIDELMGLLSAGLPPHSMTGGRVSNNDFNTPITIKFKQPLDALQRLEVLATATNVIRHVYLPRSYGKADAPTPRRAPIGDVDDPTRAEVAADAASITLNPDTPPIELWPTLPRLTQPERTIHLPNYAAMVSPQPAAVAQPVAKAKEDKPRLTKERRQFLEAMAEGAVIDVDLSPRSYTEIYSITWTSNGWYGRTVTALTATFFKEHGWVEEVDGKFSGSALVITDAGRAALKAAK